MKEVPERVQKVLAQIGLGSRREIEGWITEGKVLVNGEPAVLGSKITSSDKITVNGRAVSRQKINSDLPHRVIMYHKPVGEICTRSDPQGRITVFNSLPKLTGQRWVAIGRLDINSSGLMLFTTDGDLANKLMHPKAEIEREYAVRVLGTVSKDMLRNVTQGVTLDDGTQAKFAKVVYVGGTGANAWYNVILKAGRYREVRRIWESQGVQVSRLLRIRFGLLTLPKELAEGRFKELEYAQIRTLFSNKQS